MYGLTNIGGLMLNNQISKDYENLTLSNNSIFMKVMQVDTPHD